MIIGLFFSKEIFTFKIQDSDLKKKTVLALYIYTPAFNRMVSMVFIGYRRSKKSLNVFLIRMSTTVLINPVVGVTWCRDKGFCVLINGSANRGEPMPSI